MGSQIQTDIAGGQEGKDDGEGSTSWPWRHLVYAECAVKKEHMYPMLAQ